jgi:hypothetical protein
LASGIVFQLQHLFNFSTNNTAGITGVQVQQQLAFNFGQMSVPVVFNEVLNVRIFGALALLRVLWVMLYWEN